jgi:hypothetical protein
VDRVRLVAEAIAWFGLAVLGAFTIHQLAGPDAREAVPSIRPARDPGYFDMLKQIFLSIVIGVVFYLLTIYIVMPLIGVH